MLQAIDSMVRVSPQVGLEPTTLRLAAGLFIRISDHRNSEKF